MLILILQAAFASAIHRASYPSPYRGVFPVKCNHDIDVVKAVLEFGRPYGFGLEVGSKAELILAAAAIAEAGGVTGCSTGTLLICNGYKDAEYMELAMHIGQIGPSVVIVMEQPEEVALAVRAAIAVPTSRTVLGIRAKLGTVHGGHWASTSGDAAKFGLTSRQIVSAVHRLDTAGLLPRLALLHFHVGSQMSSLREVRDALAEGAVLYAELVGLGASGLKYLDVGGGLAIDYDGSSSEEHTSRAYGLDDYAAAVVGAVREACASRGVSPPTLISESGRALASHHAVVVFDVLPGLDESEDRAVDGSLVSSPCVSTAHGDGTGNSSEDETTAFSIHTSAECMRDSQEPQQQEDKGLARTTSAVAATLSSPLQRCSLREHQKSQTAEVPFRPASSSKSTFLLTTLRQVLDSMGPYEASLRCALRDASYFKEDTLRAFKLGMVSLAEKAAVEELVESIENKAREFEHWISLNSNGAMNEMSSSSSEIPSGAISATRMLHINLSVFRSAVDCWAIGQVFPIVPLSGMDQQPAVHAVLADLTCDSDGKLDNFINPKGGEPLKALPLPASYGRAPSTDETPHRLGLFLTGVYQETMGSNHNMFGSLNSATIRLRPGVNRPSQSPEEVDTDTTAGMEEGANNSDNGIIVQADVPYLPGVPSCMSLCSESGCGCGINSSDSSRALILGPEISNSGGQVAHGGPWVKLSTFSGVEDNNNGGRLNKISLSAIRDTAGNNSVDQSLAGVPASALSPSVGLDLAFVVERIVPGENVATVLSRAGHDASAMLRNVANMAGAAVSAQRIDRNEAEAALECVAKRMDGYTYMR